MHYIYVHNYLRKHTVDLNHFPMKYNVFSNGQVEPITDYGVQQDPEQAILVIHPDIDTYVQFTHIFHP